MRRLKPVGHAGHWLGTDENRRATCGPRIAYGARLSLLTGILPVGVALAVGGAARHRRRLCRADRQHADHAHDGRVLRLLHHLLAIAICGILGSGFTNAILALSIVFIPPLVRISESVTTQVRSLDFVDDAAARTTTSADHPPPHPRRMSSRHNPGLRDQPDLDLDRALGRPLASRRLGAKPLAEQNEG